MPPRDALARLVDDASRLTGAHDSAEDASPRRSTDRRAPRLPARTISLFELKTRVRELIAELARRVDASLPETLAQAHGAWDQVDACKLVDKAVDDEVRELVRHAMKLELDDAPERRALGLEARLTIDAAVGLCSLVERRLATLVRLRLRDITPENTDEEPDPATLAARLLPEGRPFLDLGAALHETARRWL